MGVKSVKIILRTKIFSDKCKKAYKEAAKKNRIFYLKSTKNVHKACDKTRKKYDKKTTKKKKKTEGNICGFQMFFHE